VQYVIICLYTADKPTETWIRCTRSIAYQKPWLESVGEWFTCDRSNCVLYPLVGVRYISRELKTINPPDKSSTEYYTAFISQSTCNLQFSIRWPIKIICLCAWPKEPKLEVWKADSENGILGKSLEQAALPQRRSSESSKPEGFRLCPYCQSVPYVATLLSTNSE